MIWVIPARPGLFPVRIKASKSSCLPILRRALRGRDDAHHVGRAHVLEAGKIDLAARGHDVIGGRGRHIVHVHAAQVGAQAAQPALLVDEAHVLADLAVAEVVRALGIESTWERIDMPPSDYDLEAAVRQIEDYHPLDVECAAANNNI